MILILESRVIDAPIAEVWAVTSSFGAIQAWMPGVKSVAIEGAGIGSVRTVTTKAGKAQERLTEIDPTRHRVRYAISAPGLDHITGLVCGTDLSAVDDRSTRISWIAEAEAVTADTSLVTQFMTRSIIENLNSLGSFLKAAVHGA